jgi:outer membrane beta-barrel protein
MRTNLIAFFALALAAPSYAGELKTSSDAPVLLAQAGKPLQKPAGGSSDDEDEETPVTPKQNDNKTPPPADNKTPPANGTATTPPPNTSATAAPAAAAPIAADKAAKEQELVSGAPLYNPNVAVHIVEQKAFSDNGKREVMLFPAMAQVNGKFTQDFGTALGFVWHLNENFGIQLMGQYNWVNEESGFNGELINKVRAEAQAATSLLLVWGAVGGVEVTPLYGKFTFYENTLAHFSIVLNGGAGIGGTRHQLKPHNDPTPMSQCEADPATCSATYGDTGTRFMGELGGGFRLQIGQRFSVRLEVRDLVYTARVDSVNGCNSGDLKAMDNALRAGKQPDSANVGGGCNVKAFTGIDPNTHLQRSNDVTIAYNLVKTPSSDVLNNLGIYLGLGFIF